ncbi:hypothetical protein GCM10010363_43520 [Streptomyces omiyaensis]|nr:hypothetical protein GCM10010363_43520 [Streptomyces omiyaensis]
MGTRWTAGGDEAGDIPKKRLSRSPNGSEGPKGEPNAIDMSVLLKRVGVPHTQTPPSPVRKRNPEAAAEGAGRRPRLRRRCGAGSRPGR